MIDLVGTWRASWETRHAFRRAGEHRPREELETFEVQGDLA